MTGANGQLGRAVVGYLLQHLPAERIAISVRDPGKAKALAEQGVHVRTGDFTKPDSLAAAFRGPSRCW